MPGMIEHLFFNSSIYKNLRERPGTKLYKNGNLKIGKMKLVRDDFMLSGILPDLAREQDLAHFKVESEEVPGLNLPDLELAERWLPKKIGWSVGRGVYAHLYLDYHFFVDFLKPRYKWSLETNGTVQNLQTGQVFSAEQFFSSMGLYSAYGELNEVILDRGLLDVEAIRELPTDRLPKTYLDVIDFVDEQPWREQFEEYLTHRLPRTDRIFSVEEYLEFSAKMARRCAAEMLQVE